MMPGVNRSELFFRSPWLLLIFIVIPIMVIFSVVFHFKLPLTHSAYPLLVNNACFGLLALIRFLYYLARLTKKFRYIPSAGVPQKSTIVTQSTDRVCESLSAAGYLLDADGHYGEKHDFGYIGTLLVYAGLFIVFLTGTLDNMYQFSGTIRDGVGIATDLQKLDSFKKVSVGPITADLSTLPKMRIVRQFFPSKTYPEGATEVAFRFPDGKEQETILKAPEPFRAGAYDIYMSKMVYEPRLAITIDNTKPVFNGTVTLDQLPEEVNGFSFHGAFAEGLIDGEVFYQPAKSRLRVIVNQGAQRLIDTELVFQVDRLSRSANFAVTCERMGVWSEIYVVHRRHMSVIFFGGFLALIGLLLRIVIRPQRVWLEETDGGCQVRITGEEANKLLNK
jgi:cytochrome c biogenesis protein ResB